MSKSDRMRIGLKVASALCRVKFFGGRIPLYCEWEITSHCNMTCDHCSTWIKDRNKMSETSTGEAIDLVSQLADAGTAMIHFSGGEPTLRNDLAEIIDAAHKGNMVVAVTTNGSASNERLKSLREADIIRISIDGTETYHDTLRNTPGAYRKALSAVEFLQSINIKPQITAVFSPQSRYAMMAELAGTARRLQVQLAVNVMGRNVNIAFAELSGGSELDAPVFTEYVSCVHKLQEEFGSVIANPEPMIMVIKKGGLDKFGCRAMDIAICIKPDGSLSFPCNGLSKYLRKGPVRGIYYGSQARAARKLQGKHVRCRGCYIKCMSSASGLLSVRSMVAIVDSYRRSIFA